MAKSYEQINATSSGGGGSSTPYSQTFNDSSDWTGPSLGFYTITILETTHDKGTTPIVQVYELISSDYEEVITDIVINSSGDITIRVTDNIDTRFAGRIVVL